MSIGGKLLLAVVFLVFGAVATTNHWGAIPIAIGAGGASALVVTAIIEWFRKIAPRIRGKATKIVKSSKASIGEITQSKEKSILNLEDRFFKIAGDEISKNEQDKGLWFKSLAIAEGDKAKQEAT